MILFLAQLISKFCLESISTDSFLDQNHIGFDFILHEFMNDTK